MAFDQNSSSKDMRPPQVNGVRSEEVTVLPVNRAAVRENGASGAVPLFYSDGGLVGVGYGNVATTAAASSTWCIRPGVSHPTLNPTVGLNFPNGVAGGNAIDLSGSVVANSNGYPMNLGNLGVGTALDDNSSQYSSRMIGNGGDCAGSVGMVGTCSNPPVSQRVDENGGDDSVQGKN